MIGRPYTSLKGLARKLLYGYDIAFSVDLFERFLTFLAQRRHELWNAALVDILKYEREYEAHELRLVDSSDNQMSLDLSVDTDATLYDHPLTLGYPRFIGKSGRSTHRRRAR